MERFNLNDHVEFELKNNKESFLSCFGGQVAEEVKKCEITHQLKTRPHKFADGEVGQVAHELVIRIKFKDAVVQPHTHFAEDFCHALCTPLEENINGLMENSYDASDDDDIEH